MNTNHRHPTDKELTEARLTAYALGQLDETGRRAVERELAASPEARQTVEEIRALAGHLHEAARREALPEPSAALRAALEERLGQPEDSATAAAQDPSPAKRPRGSRRRWIALAVAVCLLIAAIPIGFLLIDSLYRSHRRQIVMAENQRKLEKALDAYDRARPAQDPAKRSELLEDTTTGIGAAHREKDRADKAKRELVSAEIDAQSSPLAKASTRLELDHTEALGRIAVVSPAREEAQDAMPGSGQPYDPAERSSEGYLTLDEGPVGPAGYGTERYGEWHDGYAKSTGYGGYPTQGHYAKSGGEAPDRGYDANRRPEVVGRQMPGYPGYVAQGGALQASTGKPKGQPEATGQASIYGSGYGGDMGYGETVGGKALADGGFRYDSVVTMSFGDGRERFSAEGVDYYVYRRRMAPEPPGMDARGRGEVPGTEQYDALVENPFLLVGKCPLSTFSIDVDTASYANVRRFLNEGRWPPRDAVRIEEMVNYFKYDYPLPEDGEPFSVHMEVAQCPWNGKHRLLRIGLKGREIEPTQRGPSNLVFLLDVSGSMRDDNKLPLVKQAMRMLVDQLTEDDRVAIVTYASSAALPLESTCGDDKRTILAAIESLTAGGSTHGSAGIQLAYEQASHHFVKGGTNRVILATDGDLNVGITDDDQLVRLIQQQAKTGVFLTVLGFGTGNLKDSKLEKLADRGNGSYAYVDSLREAWKLLVEQVTGSLVTIAKDVKVQIEFNPAEVRSYRLIGYENRMLAARDFSNDRKDAGEIGAGHTVTALYELVPAGEPTELAGVAGPKLKYQRVRKKPSAELTEAAGTGELVTLRLRHKEPDGEHSKLAEFTLKDSGKRLGEASPDFQFAAAVAAFGLVLRHSPHKGDLGLAAVEEFAQAGLGNDPEGYRAELVDLVRRARKLADP